MVDEFDPTTPPAATVVLNGFEAESDRNTSAIVCADRDVIVPTTW